MKWVEPCWLEISEHKIKFLKQPGHTVRILHLSDFHASAFVSLEFIDKAVETAVALKPDIIVLTGDYITGKVSRDFIRTDYVKQYQRILRKLPQTAPTFACLGNHDGGVWAGFDAGIISEMLQQSGITVLRNTSKHMTIRNEPFLLVGVGDLWAREVDARKAFRDAGCDDEIRIVLAHNPDIKESIKEYPWDLLLCGHSHGGQLRLPLIGTPFAPVKDHRYVEGLRPWDDRLIHVTRGIGNLLGLRFNCRPQISLLILTS